MASLLKKLIITGWKFEPWLMSAAELEIVILIFI